jgi:hypothetical protein
MSKRDRYSYDPTPPFLLPTIHPSLHFKINNNRLDRSEEAKKRKKKAPTDEKCGYISQKRH